MTYGNGTTQTFSANNRLQPAEISIQATGTGLNQKILDKQYCYGPASANCTSMGAGKNNGNIWAVVDPLKSSASQAFNYDSLNRLTSFANGDNSMAQSYAYDSFGNMNQNAGTAQSNLSFNANNQISTTGFAYDAAGNMTQANIGNSVTQYMAYDAENNLINFNQGAATYIYDADDLRIRKNVGSTWTEYLNFGGQPLVEKNSDGTWVDFIVANGQRVGRADGWDNWIHIHGTMSATGSYADWTLPFAQRVIKSGDKVSWRQIQSGGARGGFGVNFTDGSSADWTAKDNNGVIINDDPQQGGWYYRTADLSAYVGKTIADITVGADKNTPAGTWDSMFTEMSYYGTDGTAVPIYLGQTSISLGYYGNAGATGTSYSVGRISTVTSPSWAPGDIVYYYGDQVGSTRMLTTAGGWPVSAVPVRHRAGRDRRSEPLQVHRL